MKGWAEKVRGFAPVLGTLVHECDTPGMPAILEASGLDFAMYDMEHSGFGWDSVRRAMSYARGMNLAALVRVPTNEYSVIARALDVRAAGVMVPFVRSRADADAIVAAAKYAPAGRRGVAAGIAHDDFRMGDTGGVLAEANRGTLLIAQIEDRDGLEHCGAIADAPGIDVVFIGHYDLSCSLGVPGDVGHPAVMEAERRIVSACRRAGKPAGRVVYDVEELTVALQAGFTFLAFASDIGVLRAGFTAARAHFAAAAGTARREGD